MNRKKAAVAVRSLRGKTGSSSIVLGHIRKLISLGFEVHVFSEKIISDAVKEYGGVPHKLLRLPVGKLFSRMWYAKRLNAIVANGHFSLIIGHGDIFRQDLLFLHNLVQREIEILGGRTQKTLAAPAKIHERIFREQEFKLCIANSEMMKSDLVGRHKISADKVEVIYPGYPEKKFALSKRETLRESFRRRLAILDKTAVGFVTSGAFERRGLDIFLETISMLDEKTLSKIAVVIVGDSANVNKYLKDHPLPSSLRKGIRIVAKTSQIEEVYHGLDILFYPARHDAFGLVVEEAAVCGLPVLSSVQVGASELFNDLARELLIPQPDPTVFAGKLQLLINDAGHRRSLGEASRQSFVHNTQKHYYDRITSCCVQLGLITQDIGV